MAETRFDEIVYKNASGKYITLLGKSMQNLVELKGRAGFGAPDIQLVTEKYVNGQTRVINRFIEPRTCTIKLLLVGKSEAERDALFAELTEQLLDIDADGHGTLYIRKSNGDVVTLNCIYASGLDVAREYRRFQRMTLEFFAEDPYFYGATIERTVDASESDIVTLAEDLFLGDWYLGMGDNAGIGVIENPLDKVVEPIIRFPGKLNRLHIVNETNGDTISMSNVSMNLGDTLVIDTRSNYKDIRIDPPDGESVSAASFLSLSDLGLSLRLQPGMNRISWTQYGELSALEFTLMDKFLTA